MSQFRTVTGTLAIVMFSAYHWAPVTSSEQTQQVRMSWQEFSKDPKRVESLARGIAAMKKKDGASPTSTDFRGSWKYWAAMHSHYGAPSSGTVAQAIAFLKSQNMGQFVSRFKGVTDMTPPDGLAKEVWDGCKHSFEQAENFFGWHRLFLYHFERVLRAAAMDDTLRLPYWDYTNPAQVALPHGFGSAKGAPINAAFFESRRTPGLNTGAQVLDQRATNVNLTLENPTFEGDSGFALGVEVNLHGYVHCTVGERCPVPFMGSIAASANDPIFWLHHANIDRIFECWMQKHKQTLPPPFSTDKFAFVDEKGARAERSVADFLDASKLEYRYDNVSNCSRPAIPGAALTANPQAKTTTVALAKGINLDKAIVTVSLPLPAGPAAGISTAEGLELVLGDISAEKSPGVMFNVYISRSGAAATEREYVGTLNFFGMGEGTHRDHKPFTRRFDATSQARAVIQRAAAPPANIEVTFEATTGTAPTGGAAAGPPSPITLAEGTQIGRVELRARPKQ